MKKVIKYLLISLLAVILFMHSTDRVNAQEPEVKIIASGSCAGGTITWSLNDQGLMEFVGNGAIENYDGPEDTYSSETQSWYRYRSDVKKLVFAEGITAIGNAAFADFEETELVLPKGIGRIGDSAFSNNVNLTEIEIPDSVTNLGKYSFYGCESLKNISVGKGVVTIPEYCFTDMVSCSVTVAFGCKEIGNKAFGGKVNRMELPATITKIDVRAMDNKKPWTLIVGASDAAASFAANKKITFLDARNTYELDEKNIVLTTTEYNYSGEAIKPLLSVTHKLDDGVAQLVEGKDYDIELINNTDIGKATVKVTGIGIFNGNKSLDYSIVANLSNAKISIEYDSVAYDGKAKKPAVSVSILDRKLIPETEYEVRYYNNRAAGEATVSISGVGYVKGSASKTFTIFKKSFFAYDDCIYMVTADSESLRTVTLSDGSPDTSIVKIPDKVEYDDKTYLVTAISSYAFKNEKAFKKIVIGSNVTKIGDNAFYGCKNLTTVKLPAKLKSIGKKAFYGCKKLKNMAFTSATVPTIGSNAFKNVYSKVVISVPASSVSSYKSALKARGLKGKKQKVVGK